MDSMQRSWISIIVLVAVWGPGEAVSMRLKADETKRPTPAPPRDVTAFVTSSDQLPVEKFPWGTLQWLSNAKLSPGAAQTVGLCEIRPGQVNPRHVHPNCEEVLHMLAGCGKHSFDDKTIELRAGMTIRIPAGVKHNLHNTGTEPIRCLISFSSGDRQTVFLDNTAPK